LNGEVDVVVVMGTFILEVPASSPDMYILAVPNWYILPFRESDN